MSKKNNWETEVYADYEVKPKFRKIKNKFRKKGLALFQLDDGDHSKLFLKINTMLKDHQGRIISIGRHDSVNQVKTAIGAGVYVLIGL